MSIDMYGEKVADAAQLVRDLTGGKEWFHEFDRNTQHTLELFIACMDKVKADILASLPSTAVQAPVREVPDEETMVEQMRDALAAVLGEAMDCTRVWSAWSYGTMGPDDFNIIAEDDDRLDEVARAAVAVFLPAAPVQQEPKP